MAARAIFTTKTGSFPWPSLKETNGNKEVEKVGLLLRKSSASPPRVPRQTRSRCRRETARPIRPSAVVRRYSRVVGRQQEIEQQAGGLLGADLVGGGHALVQLVKDGGQHHFQARHGEVTGQVHGADAVLPERLDDIPNVNQMHWGPEGKART